MKQPAESLLYLHPGPMEMLPLKPEETLHYYLRRHFEKVSNVRAQQFAKHTEAKKADPVPDVQPTEASGH